jgi:PAS domain-containing protein
MNSAAEIANSNWKPSAPQHSLGQRTSRYRFALACVVPAIALIVLAERVDLHEPIFTSFVLIWLGAAWRRGERQLRESGKQLTREAANRMQQASLLDLTDDKIFVRNLNDAIRYWNRRAQERSWKSTGRLPRERLRATADADRDATFEFTLPVVTDDVGG